MIDDGTIDIQAEHASMRQLLREMCDKEPELVSWGYNGKVHPLWNRTFTILANINEREQRAKNPIGIAEDAYGKLLP